MRPGIRTALGLTLFISVALTVAAFGKTETVKADHFNLIGSGTTIWDSANDDFAGGSNDVDGCSIRDAYTPVETGASLTGHRNRGGYFFDGAMFGYGAGQIGIYAANNKARFNSRNNTLSVGPTTINGLKMSRKDKASSTWLRSLIRMRNPANSAISTPVTWDNRLRTVGHIDASSNGDKVITPVDRWATVSANGPLAYRDSQPLGFTLSGKGAREKVTAVDSVLPADPCVTVDFDIRVPKHSTRYMLFFTEQNTTRGAQKKAMRKYNRRHLSKKLLRGISKKTRRKVLNWDL